MGTMLSGLSLLVALAIAGLLIAASRANARRIADRGDRGRASRQTWRYRPLGYAFNFTLLAAASLAAGLSGYRLSGPERMRTGTPWSGEIIWWEVWLGLAAACVAAYCWRKGLRDFRSDVYVPELAGHDASAPPSRRIERR